MIIFQGWLSPPALLFDTEEVNPEILWIWAVSEEGHHLGSPPHLGNCTLCLVTVLTAKYDCCLQFMCHRGKKCVHPDRVGINQFGDIPCPKEEWAGGISESGKRFYHTAAGRLEQGICDEAPNPPDFCHLQSLIESTAVRDDHRGRSMCSYQRCGLVHVPCME